MRTKHFFTRVWNSIHVLKNLEVKSKSEKLKLAVAWVVTVWVLETDTMRCASENNNSHRGVEIGQCASVDVGQCVKGGRL